MDPIMDSSEKPAALEEESILMTDDASPTAAQMTSTKSTATEVEVENQHILSTSRISKEMLPFSEYITDISDEEWTSFSHSMSNHMTKMHFVNVCMNITKLVTLSSLKVIIPGLVRRLANDPHLLMPSQESDGFVNIIGTSHPSITYIEDDQDFLMLKDGVLTKVNPKPTSSRSKSSLQQASFAHFGPNEEHIQHSVQESITKLSEAGIIPGSEEWIDSVAKEALRKIQSTLADSSRGVLTIQMASSPDLIKSISSKIKVYMDSQKLKAQSVEEEKTDLVLASATAETMNTVIHEVEKCFRGNEKGHPVKKLLLTLKRTVKTMACQGVSVKESDALATNVDCEKEVPVQSPGQIPSKGFEKLSSHNFQTKAKKAISDVLTEKVKVLTSRSSCPSLSIVPADSNKNTEKDEKDLSSTNSLQPVSSVASMILEVFVEEIKSLTESEYVSESGSKTEGIANETLGEPSIVPSISKNQALEAANGLYHKVHLKLKNFFKNPLILWGKSHSSPDIESAEAETLQVLDGASCHASRRSAVRPSSTTSVQLCPTTSPPTSASLRRVHSDNTQHFVALGELHLTQPQLDICTKEALKGVLTSFLNEKSEEQHSTTCAPGNSFVENVIFQLDDLMDSSSSPSFESVHDDTYKQSFEHDTKTSSVTSMEFTSASLPCLQKLSSERFQTSARLAVSEAVLKTVRSHITSDGMDQHAFPDRVQTSSFFFLPAKKEDTETEGFVEDSDEIVDSAASKIVDQFVLDMQGCAESLHSAKMECDRPQQTFFFAASKACQNLQNTMKQFLSQISSKYIRQDNHPVEEPLAGKSTGRECEQEDHSIHPLIDLNECTTEAMSKLFLVCQEEMAGENEANDMLSMPCLGDTDDSVQTVPSSAKLIQKLSEDEFQTKAAKQVSEVLLQSVRSFTDSLCSENVDGDAFTSEYDPLNGPLEVKNAASDLVVMVIEDLSRLLDTMPSSDAPASSLSDINEYSYKDTDPSHYTSQITSEDERIWSTTFKIFQNVKRQLKELFAKHRLVHLKAEEKISTSVKETVSQVTVCIQDGLAQSVRLGDHGEFLLIKSIVDSIIYNIGEDDVLTGKDGQRPSSSSSTTSKASTWNDGTSTGTVPILTEMPAENEPCTYISRESVVSAVNTIVTKLDVESNEGLSSPSEDLTVLGKRLERSLSSGNLNTLSCDLTNKVYHLFLKGQRVISATKSASDSVLLNRRQTGEVSREDITQMIQVYAEEMVRHLFLPCFNLPSSWNMESEGYLKPVSSSTSCSGFLHSMSKVSPKAASRSPSQILKDTLQVLTQVMTRDVMNLLPQGLDLTENVDEQTYCQSPDSMHIFSRPSSSLTDLKQCRGSQEITSDSPYPSVHPMDCTSGGYNSLVTMLVMRLLSKLKDEESLCDGMLDRSRELIDRVMEAIDAAQPGMSTNENRLHGVNIHKVFRAVYNDLLHESGCKEDLLRTMMSGDASFEKSLLSSLTRELIQTSVEPKPKEEKKAQRRFLPNISKIKARLNINLKRSKSGGKKSPSLDQELDPPSTDADTSDASFEKSMLSSLTRELIQTSVEPKPKEEKKAKRRFLPFLPKISEIKACLNTNLKRSKSGGKKSPSLDQELDPPSTDAETSDASFEKSMLSSLTRELIQTSVEPKPKEEKKAQRRFLPFLPKISEIKAWFNTNLKRSKSGGKKSPSLDQELDPPSTDADTSCFSFGAAFRRDKTSTTRSTTPDSPEKEPRKGVLQRITSSMSRKSSKISPEAF